MKNTMLNDFVERLRHDSPLVNIISDYVSLTKKGSKYWGCCPFHQEKTPSFSVSADKGFFYCFGCQAGGDVFSFLMKIENVGFFEAVKLLAGKLNIPLPEVEKTPRDKMLEEELEQLFKACRLAGDFFQACLLKTNYGKPAREYLDKRGITPENIKEFQLGFAPPAWDKLTSALLNRGISLDILLKAGLVAERQSNKQSNKDVYDRFRGRIMFPIKDARGRIIGFGGRTIDNIEPKYLNSPETRLFNKRHVLYGFDVAYKHIREAEQAIIVEGYLDAIAAHSFGFKNTVASLGTAFTPEQARLLLKCNNPELVFSYDSDAAGKNASDRALAVLRTSLGVKIKVVSLPDSKDPDEYLRKHGKDAFKSLVDDAQLFMDYQINRILANSDYSLIEGKINVVAQIAPLLASSDNAVEANAYISRLAQTIGIDENSLRIEINKQTNRLQKDKNVKIGKDKITLLSSKQPVSANAEAEKQLIRLMFEHNSLIPYCQTNLNIEELAGGERQEIIKFIFNAYNNGDSDNISSAILHNGQTRLSEKAASELSQIMIKDGYGFVNSFQDVNDENLKNFVDDYLKAIKLAYLKELYERRRLMADELQRTGDKRFLQELAESQRIKNEISKLHQN